MNLLQKTYDGHGVATYKETIYLLQKLHGASCRDMIRRIEEFLSIGLRDFTGYKTKRLSSGIQGG